MANPPLPRGRLRRGDSIQLLHPGRGRGSPQPGAARALVSRPVRVGWNGCGESLLRHNGRVDPQTVATSPEASRVRVAAVQYQVRTVASFDELAARVSYFVGA